ncbi:MAG: hypothetical protein IKO93_05335, partial [Lentisphaeria bacterium]|nr:hypothetical protein [Lentisphaeria bacterium]
MLPDLDQGFDSFIQDQNAAALGHKISRKIFHSARNIIDSGSDTCEYAFHPGPLGDRRRGDRDRFRQRVDILIQLPHLV